MDLLFELLLTAAATLLVAVLLAKLFSSAANTHPRHDRAVGPADVIIAEEEEERIIEVDEVKAKGAAAQMLSEGWVEVEKAPAASAAEGEAAWVAVEEGAPAALAPELFLGTVLEEQKEEGEVGKKQRDLTAEGEVAAQVKLQDLGGETTVPREILDLELEKETVQQHDLAAEAAPSQVLDAELQRQEIQSTETVVVVVEQRHPVAESAAPAEVIDAGLEEEEGAQAVEAIPHESASETVTDEALDVVPEKQQEEQVIEVDQRELAAEVPPREITDEVANELASEVVPGAIPDVVATVEEVADQHEVQNKEEDQCELGPVDQPEKLVPEEELVVTNADDLNVSQEDKVAVQLPEKEREKLVPEEELVVTKADDLNVSQESSSNDKVAVQLPEKEATVLEMTEDNAKTNIEFEEWEGIERSEVEKRFGAAAAFAASDAGAAALSKLDSDVQLQLQGLLKVAIDGPCYDSTQPLTLRPSSRAKWVSWQKLGNMHPEIAMEKYMDLLSEFIPRWIGDKTSSTKKHEGDVDSEGAALTVTARTSDPQTNQGNEGSTSIDEGPLTSLPDPEKGQSCDIPAE